MKRWLLVLFVMFGAGFATAEPVALERGQVWTFADAPAATTRLIIGDVEPFGQEGLVAVSVSITGLPRGYRILHLPFSEAALRPTLLELQPETRELPSGYADGYAIWKQAVELEGAGVYAITPAEVIKNIFEKTGNAH